MVQHGQPGLPDLGPRGEGWVLGQFLLLGLLGVAGLPGIANVTPRGLLDGGALAVGVAALGVAGWVVLAAFRDLGRNLTALPRPRDDSTLVETGIYAGIRHPIYSGLILAALGWSAVTRSLAAMALAILLAIYLDLKSRREEAWLDDRYPAYAAYRERTRRFIPRVY